MQIDDPGVVTFIYVKVEDCMYGSMLDVPDSIESVNVLPGIIMCKAACDIFG